MSKLIAISTGTKEVQMAPGEIECTVINQDFINVCNRLGATVVIVGPHQDADSINISKFDALVVTGGGDINPTLYGQELGDKTIRISDKRDSTEMALLKSAEENNIKTLAICRGHQLLNVYKGGTLFQDLIDQNVTEFNHDRPFEEAREHIHDVKINEDSKLFSIVKNKNFQVNSIHHQAVNKLGEDLRISATSSDGVVEGIESTNGWDVIGVQWHPENMIDDQYSVKIFDWLIY